MSEEIYTAIKKVQELVRAVPGVKLAPQDPTESAAEYPFAFTYLDSETRISDSYGALRSDAILVCNLVMPRTNLPVNLQTLMPFADSIQNALWEDWKDNVWDSAVAELKEIRTRLVNIELAKVMMLGLRFEIEVKIRMVIS